MQSELIRKCIKCKEDKELESFVKYKKGKNGRRNICKECNNILQKNRNSFQATDITSKKCKYCNQVQPIENFYKSKAYKDGYCIKCKKCTLEYDRLRCERNIINRQDQFKLCSCCKQNKPIDQYTKRLRSKDGLRNRCKTCDHRDEHGYRKKNPRKHKAIKLKYKYNLTLDQYDNICKQQENKCFICKKECSLLVVDHCHNCNQIRRLLCNNCNRALGYFKDDPGILLNALLYLREHYEKCTMGIAS